MRPEAYACIACWRVVAGLVLGLACRLGLRSAACAGEALAIAVSPFFGGKI